MNKIKNISIIGANGRTGIEIVKQALDRGIAVKALVRDKQKIQISNSLLEIIEGTPTNLEDVTKAISGVDAVFIALNISRKSDFPWSKVVTPTTLFSASMENIVLAMKENGVQRVITVSAWGVGDSYKEVNWIFRFLINKTNVGTAYMGHEDQEQILINSELEWTAVRPVGLTSDGNSKPTRVSINRNKKLKMSISRKDVARFMLDIMENEVYYRTSPSISNE